MPLVPRQNFVHKIKQSQSHQTIALKHAVCMAGAHLDASLAEQCYMATRYHLEHAELETDGSSIWTIEATQALLLIARFELTHFNLPRVLITLSRLRALQSTFQGSPRPIPTDEQGVDQEESARHEMAFLVGLSLSLQDTSCRDHHISRDEVHISSSPVPPYDEVRVFTYQSSQISFSAPEQSSPLCYPIVHGYPEEDVRKFGDKIKLTQDSMPDDLDLFDLFCTSLRIFGEASSHHRTTAAEVAGAHFPCFKFYHSHEKLDTDIGIIVAWLTHAGPSMLSTGPQCELRVLILLNVLGARIHLLNAATLYARNTKSLESIVGNYHKEAVSTAVGISEVLSHAGVLNADKAS